MEAAAGHEVEEDAMAAEPEAEAQAPAGGGGVDTPLTLQCSRISWLLAANRSCSTRCCMGSSTCAAAAAAPGAAASQQQSCGATALIADGHTDAGSGGILGLCHCVGAASPVQHHRSQQVVTTRHDFIRVATASRRTSASHLFAVQLLFCHSL
eukprot:TRINITY_DN2005_c0_g1_i2.p1 TRINITY_DN2005_c0_g1~~TRINITY_DN2005_c0_g1_i2.p1  ORF type:complete len:153 (+),score=32.88 TRINITY_DN2005_c0_g1_i2:234-692(+)